MLDNQLTIGNLANATDTKVETIRYYERIGLLSMPARTAGNYRAYDPEHLNRLSFIRRARDLGFSLAQVRELLSFSDQRERSCKAVDAIVARISRKLTARLRTSLLCAATSISSSASAAMAQSPNVALSKRFRRILMLTDGLKRS